MTENNITQIRYPETPFDQLMQKRIHNVLLLCSTYDAFALEEDGRIEEQLYNEYISYNLHHPPRIIQTSNTDEALQLLNQNYVDLIILMLNVGGESNVFEFAKNVKLKYPQKPIVLLTPFSREASIRLKNEDLSGFDNVFCWLGHVEIFLAIIKVFEDKMNAPYDVDIVGVQAILLVEDSIRYSSEFLSNMYNIVLTQARKFMQEGLNRHKQMLQMRGRPKILFANNYDDAVELYEKYKHKLLGIVSDMKYKRHGVMDPFAGVKFLSKVKADNKLIPTLLQSSDESNRLKAKEINAGFLWKYSKALHKELKDYMNEYFAFGAFTFRDPDTKEIIARAENLQILHSMIKQIPDNSLYYHMSRHHFSKWLNARSLFPLAEYFKSIDVKEFKDIHIARKFIDVAMAEYRKSKSRGIIAKFNTQNYDELTKFSRIGEGYIGGKARGLAFLDLLIKKNPELDSFEGVRVGIPQTVVLSTEIFDLFIEQNNLYSIGYSDSSNEEILNRFIEARLPEMCVESIRAFLEHNNNPIVIRSSSVLEDSHYQPFAGVYSTYMVSNSAPSLDINLEQVLQAVKSVYASVFFKETKAYMAATSNLIDEEKMGIVLQEVCGTKYGDRFYPTFSGVARSVNFYPIEHEKMEEGVVNVALGLGKHVVEGKKSLRFSPMHPTKILQLSSPEIALRESQKTFYSVDLDYKSFVPSPDEGINISELSIREAEKDESIYDISSVYDYANNILQEGKMYKGKRLITFANILKYKTFPLTEILNSVLKICRDAMHNNVEIEFAVDLKNNERKEAVFTLLQVRPIVKESLNLNVDVDNVKKEDTLISSNSALGNGIVEGIFDIVYIRPESFDSVNNTKIVPVIEDLNGKFVAQKKNYILVGPGRWGSSDSWLGIPVKWSQISNARLIVEAGLPDYIIDPSQGTHFFQNLTSFNVGYYTINPYRNDGWFDLEYLNSLPAVYEDKFLRHICFDKHLVIKIDGRTSKGVLLKPE